MRWPRRHPPARHLYRVLDGDSGGENRDKVLAHLEDCPDCRRRLDFHVRLRAAAGRIRHPAPPRELLDDILRSRAAGERVILPPPVAPLSRPRPVRAALLIAVLAGAAAVGLVFAPRAGAGASELRLEPARPGTGAVVEIEYRPASLLADARVLRLRGRYRAASEVLPPGVPDRLVSLQLVRSEDGLFRGALRLPPSEVYAYFAVETPDGERVDAHGNRLWELLAHDRRGVPLLEALRQRYRVLERVNWPEATATARRMTELYPDRAEGWSALLAHELQVDDEERATSLDQHRETFRRLERLTLQERQPSADELAGLLRYARLLGEQESEARLADLLEQSHPTHPTVVYYRIGRLLSRAATPQEKLRVLEAEWRRSGPAVTRVAEIGVAVARESGDAQAMRTWADRYERAHPEAADQVALTLAEDEALHAEGLARLSRLLERAPWRSDEMRPLAMSRADFRDRMDWRERELRGRLGTLLVESGRVQEGAEALESASEAGWNPEVFAGLAAVRLSEGDTTEAVKWLALVAVDPASPRSSRTAAESGQRLAGKPEWSRRLSRARLEMRDRILAGRPVPRPLPADAVVTGADGRDHRLTDLVDGRTTLIVFYDRRSYPFLQLMPELVEFAVRYRGTAVGLLSVVSEPPSPGLDAFLRRHGLDIPVFHDAPGRASVALGVWGTPELLVVDRSGRVRLRPSDLTDAVRVIEALEMEERSPS